MRQRGPMYGLPMEQDSTEVSHWDELVSHLRAIAASETSVRVAVTKDPMTQRPYFEALGKLRYRGVWEGKESFALNSANSRDEGGTLHLDQESYRGARLLTYDGDDYFSLVIEMDGAILQLQDTNSI